MSSAMAPGTASFSPSSASFTSPLHHGRGTVASSPTGTGTCMGAGTSAAASASGSSTLSPVNPGYRPSGLAAASTTATASASYRDVRPSRRIEAISLRLPCDVMLRLLSTPVATGSGGGAHHPVSLLSTFGLETADIPLESAAPTYGTGPPTELVVLDIHREGSTYREFHKGAWAAVTEPLALMQPGDVILRVGDAPVSSTEEADRTLRRQLSATLTQAAVSTGGEGGLWRAGGGLTSSYASSGGMGVSVRGKEVSVIICFGRMP